MLGEAIAIPSPASLAFLEAEMYRFAKVAYCDRSEAES